MSDAADYEALRRTIWGEARGEPFAGQVAVGWVIWNRAHNSTIRWWGSGIDGVCHAPRQFSCWNKEDPNSKLLLTVNEESPSFLSASTAAALVMLDVREDPTQASTHYHAVNITPPAWTRGATFTVQIGKHRFYRNVP